MQHSGGGCLRFGVFEVDMRSGELRKRGVRVPLQKQPFRVLIRLVERPGEVVTREELRHELWPADTYVDFELGINAAVKRLREALRDSAESPRFVETLPKRGYRFIAPIAATTPTQRCPRVSVAATPLVGRSAPLADLDRCLIQALDGRRQVVFVVGEPGIGKTSLVDAFQHGNAATSDVAIVRGQSVEGFGGKEAYYPLLEAIGQLARGQFRSVVVDTFTTCAPTWLIQLPSLVRPEQHAALQRELLGASRERMVRELCEALEVLTQTVPLVLILEDLHWVDNCTLDTISAIARRREDAKLLLLGTFRPADLILSASPLKALRQDLLLHHLTHEVELERLDESDVGQYLAAEFTPGDLPAGLAAIIHRHSDGNPLFMAAMLDHLIRQGVMSRVDGRWRLTTPLEQVDPGVPETLRQMLEMQLQHTTEAQQRLLTCASVEGQRFTAQAVATMLSDDSADVEQLCEALVQQQQVLKAAGTRDYPCGTTAVEYEFRHWLYRDVLYRRLNPATRVGFHRRLAEGFEALGSMGQSEMAAEIALHFEEGHEYERAIHYLLLTAQTATRRYAHGQAVAILEHADQLLPRIPQPRRVALDLQILAKTGNAYYALGEMDRAADAYDSMARRAADAGLLTVQAEALMRLAHPAESIPFFLRAVEIDPHFAAAYVALSRIYSNLEETEPARTYAKRAYECRDQSGERERLSIAYQYHYDVTGDQASANATLEEWKKSFPLEFEPVNSLAHIHNLLGRFERGIEEGLEAVRRNGSHGYPYSSLAHAYLGMGQFDDARKTAERAVALEIETLPTRRLLFQLAITAGDDQSATEHLKWARDKPREFELIGARAQTLGWFGRVREARQVYDDATRLAERRDFPDVGTDHLARAAVMELVYGNADRAIELAHRVLARTPGYDPQLRAALTLAMGGAPSLAKQIADNLAAANPEHTLINSVLVPIVSAGIAIGRAEPLRAIEHLEVVAPYELGFLAAFAPIYLRGQAFLMLGQPRQAAEQFHLILDHRGTDPFSPFHAIAPVGLARASAAAGNLDDSVAAYERFLTAWAQADPDVPVLLEARHEYGHLIRAAPASTAWSSDV